MSRRLSIYPALLQLLLVLWAELQLVRATDLACSPGYSLINDSMGPPTCLSPVSNNTAKFCDALEVCAALGHRLLTPNTYARVKSQPQFVRSMIHIGATDALRERNQSRDGWQVIPGLRDMNLTSHTWWATGEPGNQGIYGQNCVVHNNATNLLHDIECWSPAKFHCEHPAGMCLGGNASSTLVGCAPLYNAAFERAGIVGYSQTGPGCSQRTDVSMFDATEAACSLACKWRLGCVGFYSNALRRECVLLPHFDATVSLPYNSNAEMEAWRKLISSDLATWA